MSDLKSSLRATIPVWVFGLLAVLFVVLAVIGLFIEYSPIPYYDMWDAYVGLYAQLEAYGLEAFIKQHNEHRIIISRILFFIDITYFCGLSYFLFAVQYLFFAMSVYIFWMFTAGMQSSDRTWITLTATCMLFFWSQFENFTWAFQSQFVLAQAIPLAAFCFAWRSVSSSETARIDFFITVFLGVLKCWHNGQRDLGATASLPLLPLHEGAFLATGCAGRCCGRCHFPVFPRLLLT